MVFWKFHGNWIFRWNVCTFWFFEWWKITNFWSFFRPKSRSKLVILPPYQGVLKYRSFGPVLQTSTHSMILNHHDDSFICRFRLSSRVEVFLRSTVWNCCFRLFEIAAQIDVHLLRWISGRILLGQRVSAPNCYSKGCFQIYEKPYAIPT